MIMESALPELVKERSIQVFTELGEAEAKTHGSTLDQVKAFVLSVLKLCKVDARAYCCGAPAHAEGVSLDRC